MRKYLFLLFSYHNHIDRLTYLKGKIGQLILLILCVIFIFVPNIFLISKLASAISYLIGFIFLVSVIVTGLALNIKRLRDIGLSTWLIVLNPSINLACYYFKGVLHLSTLWGLCVMCLLISLAYFLIPAGYICTFKCKK